MKTASLIVYLCAAVLVILGVYSFMAKDLFSGILWVVIGIIIFIIGYIRLK